MPTVHTVKKGETLLRIAKQHGFQHLETIYDHPSNTEFKKLRPDPSMIAEGDEINIPEKEPLVKTISTGSSHTFQMKPKPKEKFRMKLDRPGIPWSGEKVALVIDDQTIESTISRDGLIEMDLPKGTESEGELKLFLNKDFDQPSHVITLELGHLDPVETLSGVQARCNMLGFDCGVADGIMGGKTRAGVKAFQEENGLDVDGVPGPMTKGKLKEVYGC